LLPHLDGEPGQGALPHAIDNELAPPWSRQSLGGEGLSNFFPFGNDQWVIDVAVSLDFGQDGDGLF